MIDLLVLTCGPMVAMSLVELPRFTRFTCCIYGKMVDDEEI